MKDKQILQKFLDHKLLVNIQGITPEQITIFADVVSVDWADGSSFDGPYTRQMIKKSKNKPIYLHCRSHKMTEDCNLNCYRLTHSESAEWVSQKSIDRLKTGKPIVSWSLPSLTVEEFLKLTPYP